MTNLTTTKVVPIEPTADMIYACKTLARANHYFSDKRLVEMWKVMVGAAPEAPCPTKP